MFSIHNIPTWIQKTFSSLFWNFSNKEKIVYLTFDDGPIPEITDFVLDQLAIYDFKATFFCVGDNILKYPLTFQKILDQNHAIGNHTQNHLKGWNNSDDVYYKDIKDCQKKIEKKYQSTIKLFRPPHGRITKNQVIYLQKLDYKIIMWNVLTCDYDKSLDAEKCLQQTIKYTKSGSIVVFHDSIKAEKNLKYILPKFLDYLSKANYKAEIISDKNFI